MNERRAILRFLAGRLAAWLLAVGAAYLLAVLTATQSVVARLRDMGVAIGLADRLSMSLSDITGMASMFLPMVAFALLAAFLTAALLCRWVRRGRLALYIVAGAVAVVTIHLLLHLAFGITPVAVARTAGGLALQGLAGGAGGFVYFVTRDRLARP
jgi:hypothetical protein